ncbi:MAG: phosphonate ABC transporter, permease protein PhnE [Carnobacterium sp.]|uniref:Phosphonate ABC transporter, permease protein PhnE n=1 Tax=Carnobacterium antarcticum TaxID=2126436 RepID=A0ABW4NIS4_9LACT|nr:MULTISPECIES: phosphonate ABC transporter, permease protein PhnE [unclassified Carnobacterium]ALV21481.1 Phosphonate ABC transporter permease protein phnE2 [Carnobacterium sp. CP1]QQP69484.1 phosphonate ABC transporter, permease protein PhnE [Carnobacterium sp. CS13]
MKSHSSALPKGKSKVKNLIWAILFVLIFLYSADLSGVQMGRLFGNMKQMTVILKQMASPDWSYISIVIQPLLETIQMAIIGTTFGALVALPFSLVAARNIVKNPVINGVLRFVLNIVRTVPDLMLAAVFVAIVGIGPVAGVITLSVFSFGMISKLFYEAIETIDEGPVEALTASGANKMQIIRYAIFPQVSSHFFSYFLYCFEINVRASTVLGYIGAGGIGIFLQRSLSQFRYDRTAVIVIVIFLVVLVIDAISNKLRERLL